MPRNDDPRDISHRGSQPYQNLPDEEDYTYREPYRGERRRLNTTKDQGYEGPFDNPARLGMGQEFNAERAYTHKAGYPQGHVMDEHIDWGSHRSLSQSGSRPAGGISQGHGMASGGSQSAQRQQYPQRGPWHEETYGGPEAGWHRAVGPGGRQPYHSQHEWHDPTPHYAPKGYIRSDDRIREDICEQLIFSGMDVRDVTVEVKDGRVLLDGTVSNRRVKHAIEDCADASSGVKDVDNRIRVVEPYTPGETSIGGQSGGDT
ncbi:BON domain-containing protein [Pusillimonas sp. TS35]|uniref:BON domain-containing protein n=1 Tax=Paracandidimonas lactea TaxID=2895524 RepID=UPI00136BF73F|nr:BON domain-containing protein [Paracandidimonas lactea]MYN14836.1 BON domain-containing protein [Pusillimonas sp. TS35]